MLALIASVYLFGSGFMEHRHKIYEIIAFRLSIGFALEVSIELSLGFAETLTVIGSDCIPFRLSNRTSHGDCIRDDRLWRLP